MKLFLVLLCTCTFQVFTCQWWQDSLQNLFSKSPQVQQQWPDYTYAPTQAVNFHSAGLQRTAGWTGMILICMIRTIPYSLRRNWEKMLWTGPLHTCCQECCIRWWSSAGVGSWPVSHLYGHVQVNDEALYSQYEWIMNYLLVKMLHSISLLSPKITLY